MFVKRFSACVISFLFCIAHSLSNKQECLKVMNLSEEKQKKEFIED